MSGATVNPFLAQSALKEAQAVIEREDVIRLSPRDWNWLLGLMENPAQPNVKLKAAVKLYEKAKRDDAGTPLTGNHEREGFYRERQELNDWQRQIARQHQDKSLGKLLLVDALGRARLIYREAGGIGLFVDAIDVQAARYYQRLGFAAAPDNPLQLFLSVKVVACTL